MASIRERVSKDGKVTYQIRVHRGKGIKPFNTNWTPQDGWTKKRIEKELNKFVAQFENDCKHGLVATEKKTFDDYANYVIDLKESSGIIKARTSERYRDLLKRVNDPDCNGIGFMKLEDIRAEHLNKFYQTLGKAGMNKNDASGKTGLSAKTIREHHRLISMVLAQALKENLVQYNVAERSMPPKVQRHEAEHYELSLIRDILEALESEDLKWNCLMNVMISSGARLGEVMGLRWQCVDFENSRILIKNNLQYLPSKGVYETTTKTGEERYIALPDSTMNLLRAWKIQQSDISGKLVINGFCFTKDDGIEPMHPQSVKCFLDRFSKRHGFPHLHAHAFRHTQATLLIASGSDIVSVSKRLGHADTTTTLNIYSHAIAEADKKSANTINTLLYGKEIAQ